MLHNIAGLVNYLAILIGIRIWPENDATVCFVCYGGMVLFYAVLLGIQIARAIYERHTGGDNDDVTDLRSGLPGFPEDVVDLRTGLPQFSGRKSKKRRS